jgi:hypothetical protein
VSDTESIGLYTDTTAGRLTRPKHLRTAIGIRSQSTFSLADLHDALHRRTCDTFGCTSETVQYINMKTTARLCSKCFYPHAWRVFKSFGFASGLPQEVGVYERVDWAKGLFSDGTIESDFVRRFARK